MTTLRQVESNRRNAGLSTGPRTPAGKSVARMNALSHGLRAASPVVPGEDLAAWESYREAMVTDLTPVGVLEEELADRVALLSWRLRRVSGFEAAAVARNSDKAARKARGDDPMDERLGITAPLAATPKTVQGVIDQAARAEAAGRSAERLTELLARLVVAKGETPLAGADAVFLLRRLAEHLPEGDADEFDGEFDDEDEYQIPPTRPDDRRTPPAFPARPGRAGGTAPRAGGVVRVDGRGGADGLERMARSAHWPVARLLEEAARGATAEVEQRRQEAAELRSGLDLTRRLTAEAETIARRRSLVSVEVVDVVTKYEGHLQRQLTQTLHELERRQALRSDHPPQPPAALDVTVHAPDGVQMPALHG